MYNPQYNYDGQQPVITQPPGPMGPPGMPPQQPGPMPYSTGPAPHYYGGPPPQPPPVGFVPPAQGGYMMPQGGEMPQAMMMQQPQPPPSYPGCPPGLEYLTSIDQLLVKQQVELAEVLLGCETNNKYKIKNSLGQDVYFAKEKTDCCTRQCCGPIRPFEMKVFDNYENEVIHFSRPLRCQGCCWPCCPQEIEVSAPRAATVLGYVRDEWSICVPRFAVMNAARETIFKIEGPVCTCKCCSDVKFKILATDGETKIGAIRKQWTGMVREAFTDADYFNVTFPLDLDVTMKAVLLGALFLIDFMYFEQQQNQGAAL